MKPRHRINGVHWYKNSSGNVGFTIYTKNGNSTFPMSGTEQALNYTVLKLRDQLPHIYDEIKSAVMAGITITELREMLIGRYIYGFAVKSEFEGITYRTIA